MAQRAPSVPSPSLSQLWTTLGDRSRLRLLALLRGEELSVAELQQVLSLSQPTISNHLSILRSSALVQARREGQRIYYSLHPRMTPPMVQLFETALLTLEEDGVLARDEGALAEILKKRQQEAQEYFNRVAGRLGKAHCPGRTWAAIGPLLAQFIPRDAVIADLGAGEGWLSLLLAQCARRVIAIDHSPKMVEFAKEELTRKGVKNLEYRLGDLAKPPVDKGSVDFAVMSQALHHAPKPAQAVAAAAALLKPGGTLLVLDLHQHHFDQARDRYGDYWLGFSEADLRLWGKRAGLTEVTVQLLEPDPEPPHLQPVLMTGRME